MPSEWWKALRLTSFMCGLALLGALSACQDVVGPDDTIAQVDSVTALAPNVRLIRVTWGTPPAGREAIAGFVIERRTNFNGPFEVVQTIRDVNARSWADTRIDPETWYGYRVRVLSLRNVLGPPSTVQGALALPMPGVLAVVQYIGSGEGAGPDPDGFILRIRGPKDTAVAIAPTGNIDSVRVSPLPLGTYTMSLTGISSACDVPSDTVRSLAVVDTASTAFARGAFTIACYNPSTSRIAVLVSVNGTGVDNAFRATLDGERSGTNLPDSIRLVARDLPVSINGSTGSASFSGVLPGQYRVRLADVAANCALSDTTTRRINAVAQARDTVRFTVQCQSANPTSNLPVKVRSRFATTMASVGGKAALDVSMDTRDSSASLNVSGYTLRVQYDNSRLRVDSVVNSNPQYSTFNANPTFAPNVVSVTGARSGAGPTGVIPAYRVHFTVLPGTTVGATISSETRILAMSSFAGGTNTPIPLARIGVAEEGQLTITAGSGGGTNATPSASAGGPYTGTVGTALTLTAAGSSDPDGTIASYAWTFGDGTTGTGATPTKTYAAAGTYTARVTVTDNLGATASASATVTISTAGGGPGGTVSDTGGIGGRPIGVRFRFPSTTVDSGATITAEVTADARDSSSSILIVGATYQLKYNRRQLEFLDARPGEARFSAFSPNADAIDGADTVILVIQGASGGTGATARARLALFDFKVIGARGSAPSVVIKRVRSFARWGSATPGGAITNVSVDTARIGLSGDTITINGSGGGPAPVNRSPIAAAGGPYTGTAGTALTLTAAGSSDPDGTIASYAWTFGDGTTGTGVSPSKTYAAAGTYTATVTVTDNAGATAAASATVTIAAAPPSGGTTPIVWTNAFGTVAGGTVTMTAQVDLRADVADTPGTEVLQRFSLDSLVIDPTVLSCLSGCVNFPAGVSRTSVDLSRIAQGVITMSGQLASPVNQGLATIVRLNFTVVGTGGRSMTTRTYINSLLGDASTGNFEYKGRTRVVEGTVVVP
jgi:PKD repeat protein